MRPLWCMPCSHQNEDRTAAAAEALGAEVAVMTALAVDFVALDGVGPAGGAQTRCGGWRTLGAKAQPRDIRVKEALTGASGPVGERVCINARVWRVHGVCLSLWRWWCLCRSGENDGGGVERGVVVVVIVRISSRWHCKGTLLHVLHLKHALW